MRKSPKKYSNEEKLRILREYHESGMSKHSFCSHSALSGSSVLNRWLKEYENEKDFVPLQSESSKDDDMANRSKEDYREEIAQQKRRIRELEKALEFSRLETLARDMMIDKAEEYFDISIRKKSGAK